MEMWLQFQLCDNVLLSGLCSCERALCVDELQCGGGGGERGGVCPDGGTQCKGCGCHYVHKRGHCKMYVSHYLIYDDNG